MPEQGLHIRFSDLKIKLRSQDWAEVEGTGDLFINNHYIHFMADDPQPGCRYQCNFTPWDMITFISYNKL